VGRDNIEVIQRAVDHVNETGVPAWDLIDPEITFTTRGELASRTTFTGHEGFEEALSQASEVWDAIRWEIQEIIGTNDAFVVALRFHLRGKGSGIELEVEEAWSMWMRDGRILRVEQWGTRAEALEAAGLEE
jgi:ketosteroid isomerase-like protein